MTRNSFNAALLGVSFCLFMSVVASFSPVGTNSAFGKLRKAYGPFQMSGGAEPEKKKGFFAEFFEELDAFVDDATSRRLGAGSAFYGKRKSNFYGKNDSGRKQDRNVADPTEDYQGPSSSGYFKWMPDENGQMRPVTRMKEKIVERNPSFWDRAFAEDEK